MKKIVNKKLAKSVKKLIYSNRFTLMNISSILDTPIEDCIEAFELYYKQLIPASLIVVGNKKARESLKTNIKNAVPTLLVGPNGTGKDIAIREIANSLNLEVKKCVPLKQADLVIAFGKGPLHNNLFLYVVDVDSLSKKTYAVLLNYIKNAVNPIILTTILKTNINKQVTKNLEIITFSVPSPNDISNFLKSKYGWEGDIKEIYDEDMRIVINRALSGSGIDKVETPEPIDPQMMAMNISCGYTKLQDFNRMKEPLWFTLRWLAYNQRKKLRSKNKQLENLKKLSKIDSVKHSWNKEYLKPMVLDLHKSPVRTRFSWPPWPKKKGVEEVTFEKISKPKTGIKKKSVELKQVDFSKWL